jgi:hypothetical protein
LPRPRLFQTLAFAILRRRRQSGTALAQLGRHLPQAFDAGCQALVGGEFRRRFPQNDEPGTLFVYPLRKERSRRFQQMLAHLSRQHQRRHFGHVREQVRGILQPQAILHETRFPRLGDEILKHLHETLLTDAIPKVGALGVMGHRLL